MIGLVGSVDGSVRDITPRVDSTFHGLRLRNRARDLIIVWDNPPRFGKSCAKCMGGTRGVRPMPEWLNSLLISPLPSEVRR